MPSSRLWYENNGNNENADEADNGNYENADETDNENDENADKTDNGNYENAEEPGSGTKENVEEAILQGHCKQRKYGRSYGTMTMETTKT